LALAAAYMNIQRYDLAEKALDKAENVADSGRLRQKLESFQQPPDAG
jgi:hypothetical protein